MRSPKLIDTLSDEATLTQRKKPGRKPREKPLCAYPGCERRVTSLASKHCTQSHAMLHNAMLRGTAKRTPKPAPQPVAPKAPARAVSLIGTAAEYDLFAPLDD